MLDQDQTEATEIAQLPRNKDGSIRKTFVKSVARRIETGDASGLRGLVGDLHEADMGDLIEALEPEQRSRLVELLGIDFDFTALTEVDDTVRDEILEELEPQTVAGHYASAVSLANRFASLLVARGSGYICGVSSVAGERGRQSNYFYGSTKAAFSAYLAGLRNRLFRHGVAVVTIKPGFVDTSMTWGLLNVNSPLVAQPDRVARTIAKAIQKRRNVVYVPWFWAGIMCVIRLIPEALFKRLSL